MYQHFLKPSNYNLRKQDKLRCLLLLIAELSWTRLCFPWSAPGPISNPPEFLHWPWVHSLFQGFGSVSAEHWLGNEFVYMLTSQRQYSLRVELTDWDGHKAFSQYDRFHIGSEKNKYRYWKSCNALFWCWFIQATLRLTSVFCMLTLLFMPLLQAVLWHLFVVHQKFQNEMLLRIGQSTLTLDISENVSYALKRLRRLLKLKLILSTLVFY